VDHEKRDPISGGARPTATGLGSINSAADRIAVEITDVESQIAELQREAWALRGRAAVVEDEIAAMRKHVKALKGMR
jgi:hypothetical protein